MHLTKYHVTKIVALYIVITVLLFILLSWKNPVYEETTVVLFPKSTVHNAKIYYSTKYGYRDDLAFDTNMGSNFYTTIIVNINDNFVITCNTCTKKISVNNQSAYYNLGKYHSKIGIGIKTVKIPSQYYDRNIYLLITSVNNKAVIYISTIAQYYNKQLIHRKLNTNFSFYAVYNKDKNIIISNSTEDTSYYKPNYEVQNNLGVKKDKTSIYLDDKLVKYKADNFNRKASYDAKLIPYNILLALILATIISYIVINIRDIIRFLQRLNKEGKVFLIILIVYIATLFISFSPGIYARWDSITNVVTDLGYISIPFGNFYMVLEYLFYLLGYDSRAIFALLIFATMIYFYRLILIEFIKNKIIMYLLIAIPCFSIAIIYYTLHTQRYYLATLFLIFGIVLMIYNLTVKKKLSIVAIIAYISILFSAFLRQDFIIYLLPLLFLYWKKKISIYRTILVSSVGIMSLVVVLSVHKTDIQSTYKYSLINYVYAFYPYADKYQNSFTNKEKNTITKVFNGGVSNIARQYNKFPRYSDIKFLNHIDANTYKKFTALAIKYIKSDPYPYIQQKLLYLYYVDKKISFAINPFRNYPLDYPNYGFDTLSTEIVHNTTIYKDAYRLLLQWNNTQYVTILSLLCSLLSFIFIRYMPISGILSLSFLLHAILVVLIAPGILDIYFSEIVYWFYFSFGIILVELLLFNSLKKAQNEIV